MVVIFEYLKNAWTGSLSEIRIVKESIVFSRKKMLFLFTLTEICHILGVTPLELFISTLSWLTFSILLSVKHEQLAELKWVHVFIPLYVNIGLQWYLSTIVLIRRFRMRSRPGVVFPRYIVSMFSMVMILLTEILLMQQLEDNSSSSTRLYIQVFAPYFVWLVMVAIFYCAGCTRQQAPFQPVTFNNN
ncbi:transmembrane protein 203-like [Watersipora subatra]|uniref:transmembrane protein 203-like n=1 Tax=Watersipora subatra TaxID=2589382 RepID=UPI00355BCCEA